MPYVRPPSSPDDAAHDLPPLKLRPKHRRTRSAGTFSDERGSGAFVGLSVPRRKSASGERKATFHFNEEESDSSDETRSDHTTNALQLTVDTKNIPSNLPSPAEELQQSSLETSSLPFPSRGSPNSSPLPPPSPTRTVSTASSGASIPRTPSTPIILSNGKPLKPSLKSSHSSPHFLAPRLHTRAQSEPATPSTGPPKNVHFAGDESLRSVRVFKSTGKPVNVSRTNAEETETETEYDSSNPVSEQNGFPFPVVTPQVVEEPPVFEIDWTRSSPIPTDKSSPYANVHTESVVLPRTGAIMLRGSVLVRNLAFAKDVAVRFTLDNWATTSEVACKHVVSLPALPPPFPSPSSIGDIAAQVKTWDRFSFAIRLEDFERKLHEKTLIFVVRYTAPTVGEWWDNNAGNNYCLFFKKANDAQSSAAKASSTVNESTRLSPVMGNSQQRTFSAPPTLKGTPTTEAVQAIAHGSTAPNAKITFPAQRQHRSSMFAARPSPPIRHNSSPQPTLSSLATKRSPSESMRASAPSKLNLLNYAAPVHTPVATPRASETRFVGLSDAAPPSDDFALASRVKEMSIVNGMPATAPQTHFAWPPSNNSSSQSLNGSTPPPSYSALPAPHENQSKGSGSSPPTSPMTTDSHYAAFVKQWCFVQSPTPSPSLTPPPSGGSTPRANATPISNTWRAALGMDAFGSLYGNGMRSDSPMLAGM